MASVKNTSLPLPAWYANQRKTKTERTPEMDPLIDEIYINTLKNNRAILKKWYRVKVDGEFIQLKGSSRWKSERTLINALKSVMRRGGMYKIQIDLLPTYMAVPDINVDDAWDKVARVSRYESYTRADADKDIKRVLASPRIEIVEQLEV